MKRLMLVGLVLVAACDHHFLLRGGQGQGPTPEQWRAVCAERLAGTIREDSLSVRERYPVCRR